MFQQQPNMGFSTLQTDFQDDGADSPSFSPIYIQILENDLADWSTQGYVLVADDRSQVPNNTTWAVYKYTSLSDESSNGTDDSLNGLSRADAVNRNFSSSHTFSGADVIVADSADQLNDIIAVLNGNQPMPNDLNMGSNSITNQSTTWNDFNTLISPSESGVVSSGDVACLITIQVNDGQSLSVYRAGLTLVDGQAVPSGIDLIVATLDNTGGGTSQVTILSGDGASVYDNQTGNPLASYTNSSGGAKTVMIGADNGNWNTGSGAGQDVHCMAMGGIN